MHLTHQVLGAKALRDASLTLVRMLTNVMTDIGEHVMTDQTLLKTSPAATSQAQSTICVGVAAISIRQFYTNRARYNGSLSQQPRAGRENCRRFKDLREATAERCCHPSACWPL